MRDQRSAGPRRSVGPGEIWLIEHDPGDELCSLDSVALTKANVILYERALAPLVAELLPIHAYAEPLTQHDGAAPMISRRAVEFAATGWSVVQLVAPPGLRRDDVRVPALVSEDVPAQVIAKVRPSDPQASDHRAADVASLPTMIAKFAPGEALTVVIGPLARSGGAAASFTANGLAG